VGQIAEAGAMRLADPVLVERLEVLEGQEVKQHHDEQHLGARQLARALSCGLRRLVNYWHVGTPNDRRPFQRSCSH